MHNHNMKQDNTPGTARTNNRQNKHSAQCKQTTQTQIGAQQLAEKGWVGLPVKQGTKALIIERRDGVRRERGVSDRSEFHSDGGERSAQRELSLLLSLLLLVISEGRRKDGDGGRFNGSVGFGVAESHAIPPALN